VQVGVEVSDLLDCSNMYIKPQLSYEVLGTIGTYNVHFSLYVFHSSDIWYSDQIFNSKNCFGCVGLRNKQYCIFNKQYTPEDYEQTVAQIITHMQTTGEWGEYFPIELSPFAYNESVANEYLPLTKDEAIAHGFRWKEPAVQSDSNQNDPTVLHCSVTNKPFKLTPQEIKFYQQQSLPLPTKCPEQRYKERMAIRNPRTLWSRRCSNCTNQFNTTFSPDRTELVYCEQCYQKELY
jgi:CxxC-x17-CxxC domain-containing protein